MEISVLASGSNGNSCLVEDKGTSLLIDAGKSCKETESRLNSLGKSLENADAVILTHSHIDHSQSVGVISRRYNLPVYMTNQVFEESRGLGELELKQFSLNRAFRAKGLTVKPVQTSHDVSSCGFIIGKFGLFTDTGIVTRQMEASIGKLKGVLLESNYDIDMLINGRYPYFLKQRIMSDTGHLSNIHASQLIEQKGKKLDWVLLGHLSANNNTPEAVKKTFETIVGRKTEHSVLSREGVSGVWDI